MKSVLKGILKSVVKGVIAAYDAVITDNLYLDPSDSNNARIVGQGTNEIDGTIYSAKAIDLDGGTGFIDSNQTLTLDANDELDIVIYFNADTLNTGILWGSGDEQPDTRGIVVATRATGDIQLLIEASDGTRLQVRTLENSYQQDRYTKLRITKDSSRSASGITFYLDDIEITKQAPVQDDLSAGEVVSGINMLLGAQYPSNASTYFNGQIAETTIDINGTRAHTWGFESGKEAIFFDSTTGVAATLNGGATWITGLSGFNYDPSVSNALKDNPSTRLWLDGTSNIDGASALATASGDFDIIINTLYLTDTGTTQRLFHDGGNKWLQVLSNGTIQARNGSFTATSTITVPFNEIVVLTYSRRSSIAIFDVNGVEENTGVNIGGSSASVQNIGHNGGGNFEAIGIIDDIDYGGTSLTYANSYNGAVIGSTLHAQQFPEIGLPQPANSNSNLYDTDNLTGNTSLSGTALTGSGTSFTSELTANDVVLVGGNWVKVSSVTDNTNAVVTNPNSHTWTTETTTRFRQGTELSVPAKSTNSEEDIFDNAIANSIFNNGTQVAWSLKDGQSYIDTNWIASIDWDTAFELEMLNVLFNELGSTFILLGNLMPDPEQEGIQLYKRATDALAFSQQHDQSSGDRLDFTIGSPLAINTSYAISLSKDNTGLVAGITASIDNVAQSKSDITDNLNSLSTISTNTIVIGKRGFSDSLYHKGLIGRTTLRLT